MGEIRVLCVECGCYGGHRPDCAANGGEEPAREAPKLLFDRVRLAREGADVERCHTAPHAERYSVGHHSAGVAQLLVLCWQAAHDGEMPKAGVIAAALFHDTAERITGDVPQPVKHLLDPEIDMVDCRVEEWLGVAPHLTYEEAAYLHAADRVELYLWCVEQRRKGDSSFDSWTEAYDAQFKERPLPWPFMEVMKMASETTMRRLDWARLKEIAGW
jgi:5'-deoxynucleotidase YfbR-like HD superfamily hydrolase